MNVTRADVTAAIKKAYEEGYNRAIKTVAGTLRAAAATHIARGDQRESNLCLEMAKAFEGLKQ